MQVKDTFSFKDGMRSYFGQLFPLNAGGIIPSGPTLSDLGLERAPGRGAQQLDDVFYCCPSPVVQPSEAVPV